MASPFNVEVANNVSRSSSSSQGSTDVSCWKKVVDLREAKFQILFAVPMILSNGFYLAITLVSVMFAGHLGDVELAGSTLANSWATVTGFAFMTGLSGALETLCGQGFGAKKYRMLGIYLQSSCIISFVFSILVSILWIFTEPVLVSLHQDHDISRMAAVYTKYLIPGLFAYGFLQNILRFIQTQSIVVPLVLFSAVPLGIHFGVTYGLVNKTSLGFKGAALSASISMWISVLSLVAYVVFDKNFKDTWKGWSFESFGYVLSNLKLALPSAAMICLEYWAFEILVFLAGVMPNSEITTPLIAICSNTENIAYMITYGLSASASTRVSNELGAGNPKRAKHAMTIALELSVLLGILVVLALGFGHDVWARFFSNSHSIIEKFGEMTPLLVATIAIDAVQGVFSGVARGCGWQTLAVLVNLGTFYFIGMPIAIVLGFKAKLYVKGLWIGLICGLSCQCITLMFITFYREWTKIDISEENDHDNDNENQLYV